MEKLVPNIKICIDGTFLAIKILLFADGAKLLLRKWGKHRSLGYDSFRLSYKLFDVTCLKGKFSVQKSLSLFDNILSCSPGEARKYPCSRYFLVINKFQNTHWWCCALMIIFFWWRRTLLRLVANKKDLCLFMDWWKKGFTSISSPPFILFDKRTNTWWIIRDKKLLNVTKQ